MDYEIACTGGTPASKRRGARAVLERFGADSESSALVKAVENNDVDTVEQLLASGVDLSVPDPAGNTVLHTAARRGHADLCALLISHGADVDCPNKAWFTPLFFAARVDLQTVGVLLDLGAQVRLRNHLGEIALHAAASSGLIDVIVTLVSCGSDVNARSTQDVTPLYCAVGSGSRQAVKTLLRLGAEVNSVVTPELSNPNCCSSASPCEEEPCSWKESTDGEDAEHLHHVRVRVPRQKQHQLGDEHGPAGQQLPGCVVSDRPDVFRHRPGQHDAAHRRQCGCLAPGCQGHDRRSDRDLCARHHHHHHSHYHHHHVCPTTSSHPCQTHSQHQHRLDQKDPPPCPSSLAHTVFNVLENEHDSHVEESLSEDSRIPQPVSKTRRCSGDKVTQLENLAHSSPGHMTARNRPSLHFSTCPVQMSTRQTQIPHPTRKTVSYCPAAEERHDTSEVEECSASFRQSLITNVEHHHPNEMEKSSAPFRQSQKTNVDKIAGSQPDLRFRSSPHPHQTESAPNPLHCPGLTALHRACQLGMESVAEMLLEGGARVRARTERGETPLHMAALYSSTAGHGEVTGLIRLLLGAGADIEAVTTPAGSTPLHLAAMVGDALCTSLLISHSADIHKQDRQGNTPLHKACERVVSPEGNRVRTVRLLLTNKASAQTVNNEGLTPLHVLLMHKTDDMDHDVLRVLLNHHADPNLATPSGESPLLMALRNRMYGFAKVLVEKGADPNIAEGDGKTPLHYVCKEGQLQLFKLLWSKGGNPATLDHDGFTPLRYALESGEEMMVGACISSGASTRQPSPGPIAASSLTDLFSNPAACPSPFQFAFATAQRSLLSTLYHSGCFSFGELRRLRQLCAVTTSLQGLTYDQREVVSFVLSVGQTPASLQNLSRWTISRLIGCGADRKRRARELGLPNLLRDFVLFVKAV